MSINILGSLSLLMGALSLSACGTQPPKCSDNSTLSLVKEIIFEHFDGVVELSKEKILANMTFSHPRAAAYEEKIKKYSCEANLTVGEKYEVPITYESQLDDNDQHLVTVGAISQAGLSAIHMGLIFAAAEHATSKNAKTDGIEATMQSQATGTPSENPAFSLTLPNIEPSEPYGSVRQKMLSAGWNPFHAEDADTCGDEDPRCQGRPEMATCAGTGMANCRFLWKKNEKIVGICTVGEEEAVFDNYCD